MKIILDSHLKAELIDPIIQLISTLDNPNEQTFTPTIRFVSGENQIGHTMPSQPYVKGTWTDEDVATAIEKYIDEIKLD
jgi:hypothetical protein